MTGGACSSLTPFHLPPATPPFPPCLFCVPPSDANRQALRAEDCVQLRRSDARHAQRLRPRVPGANRLVNAPVIFLHILRTHFTPTHSPFCLCLLSSCHSLSLQVLSRLPPHRNIVRFFAEYREHIPPSILDHLPEVAKVRVAIEGLQLGWEGGREGKGEGEFDHPHDFFFGGTSAWLDLRRSWQQAVMGPEGALTGHRRR